MMKIVVTGTCGIPNIMGGEAQTEEFDGSEVLYV